MRLLSVKEVAKILDVSERTVRRYIRRGLEVAEWRTVKGGKTPYFTREAVEQFLLQKSDKSDSKVGQVGQVGQRKSDNSDTVPNSLIPQDFSGEKESFSLATANFLCRNIFNNNSNTDCTTSALQTLRPAFISKPKKVIDTEVPFWAQEVALARFELVREFASKKSVKEKEEFVEAYNTGELFPKIYKKLGKVSLKTLYRWQKTLNEYGNDFLALAPDWGRAKRGKTKVTDEEAKVLLSQLLHQNRFKIAQAIKITKYILKEKGIPSPSSHATLRRFAKSFQKAHYDIWVLAREGEKALID
ncbi:DNA binding domain-containing protein, excisionase family [Desulfonauticus submarinus]|uniref:DNA binding domain-containing protein, excisionase family n=1 Tax=Desulfonauticus submarinus TaxID=206665 RepID=A0A1H0G8S0_9BACT|nr:helix-turn-helix domain-containing protein [Desulfonauticus submarinus]SDO03305.1 DNA binding domain-containing protein, excisionase family [Desulfonauticus submarinus]